MDLLAFLLYIDYYLYFYIDNGSINDPMRTLKHGHVFPTPLFLFTFIFNMEDVLHLLNWLACGGNVVIEVFPLLYLLLLL